jgi:hypothetical protein
MSLFTAKGVEAEASANRTKVDLKKVYIRLKDGESVRVRLLGITDNTVREYQAQGDFNLGIYTQPDISPLLNGDPSPLTVASNSGIEKFSKLYPKKRYLFVFADIDSGELRVWDASKTQGKAMLSLMSDYQDSIDSIPFTLKRTGTKTETSFNLMPIMKLKGDDKEKFEAVADLEVSDDFLDNVLIPRNYDQQVELLKQAGFPVADFFNVEETDAPVEDTVEDIDADETKNF